MDNFEKFCLKALRSERKGRISDSQISKALRQAWDKNDFDGFMGLLFLYIERSLRTDYLMPALLQTYRNVKGKKVTKRKNAKLS